MPGNFRLPTPFPFRLLHKWTPVWGGHSCSSAFFPVLGYNQSSILEKEWKKKTNCWCVFTAWKGELVPHRQGVDSLGGRRLGLGGLPFWDNNYFIIELNNSTSKVTQNTLSSKMELSRCWEVEMIINYQKLCFFNGQTMHFFLPSSVPARRKQN